MRSGIVIDKVARSFEWCSAKRAQMQNLEGGIVGVGLVACSPLSVGRCRALCNASLVRDDVMAGKCQPIRNDVDAAMRLAAFLCGSRHWNASRGDGSNNNKTTVFPSGRRLLWNAPKGCCGFLCGSTTALREYMLLVPSLAIDLHFLRGERKGCVTRFKAINRHACVVHPRSWSVCLPASQ